MKKILIYILSAVTVFSLAGIGRVFAAEEEKITFYVSANAQENDKNDGSMDFPFATLEKARDTIRQMRENGEINADVTVYIRGGEYVFEKAFELEAADGGNDKYSVTYEAYPGEQVLFSGAPLIPANKFTAVTNKTVIAKIPEEARDKVLQVNLRSIGISDYGDVLYTSNTPGAELYAGEKVMTAARWPNGEYAKFGTVTSQYPIKFTGTSRAVNWANVQGAYVEAFWGFDWDRNSKLITSVNTSDYEITVAGNEAYTVLRGQRYFVHNLIEELDSPGEYYINRDGGILYFYPEGELKDIRISVLNEPFILGENLENIHFKGISFEFSRGNAITIDGFAKGSVENCTVKNIGGMGIDISNAVQSRITGCDITQTGHCGIYLRGGDKKTLSYGSNIIDNCDVYNCLRLYGATNAGIQLDGVGNKIINSRIHHMPHQAVRVWGNEHEIYYNEIYEICKNSGDCGAIYNGESLSQRGLKIKYNYFHDIYDLNGGGANAIYLDDMLSDNHIEKNLFYNCGNAVMIHGGRDNIVNNNVIINCLGSINVLTYYHRNNPVCTDWETGKLCVSVYSVEYSKPPFSELYPNLEKTVQDILNRDSSAFYPKDNRIFNNVIYNSGEIYFSDLAMDYSYQYDNEYKNLGMYVKE